MNRYFNRMITPVVLLLTIFLSWRCGSPVRVQFDYVKDQDFKPYRTFDFLAVPAGQKIYEKAMRRVKTAVIDELEAKGFEMQFQKPDFLVAIQVSVDSKVNINNWGYAYAPYDRYYGGYGYWGVSSWDVYQYEEGTIVLDIIDPASMTMIWRGVAQRALPQTTDSQRIQEIVQQAVRRVLAYWPPE